MAKSDTPYGGVIENAGFRGYKGTKSPREGDRVRAVEYGKSGRISETRQSHEGSVHVVTHDDKTTGLYRSKDLKTIADHASKPSSGTNSPDLDKVTARKELRSSTVIAGQMMIRHIENKERIEREVKARLKQEGKGGGGDQPRVPAGSSDGGQWTKG